MPQQGYPDWAGLPLVSADIIVLSVVNQSIAHGANQVFSAAVIRSAYNIRLNLQNITDNTSVMPVNVNVAWIDSASGQVVNRQIWDVYASTSLTSHVILGHGPTEGDTVQITITNNATLAANLQVNMLLSEATRTYSAHDWRTDTSVSYVPCGTTALATCNMPSGVMAAENSINIIANATQNFMLPLMCGVASLSCAGAGPTGTLLIQLLTAADQTLVTQSILAQVFSTSGQLATYQVALPRSQCILLMHNSDVAARACNASLVANAI